MPASTNPSPPGVWGTLLIRLATPHPRMRMPTGIHAPKARKTAHRAASSSDQANADHLITRARSRPLGGSAAMTSADRRHPAWSSRRRSSGSARVNSRSRTAAERNACRAVSRTRVRQTAAATAIAANTRGTSSVSADASAPPATIMLSVRVFSTPTPTALAVAVAPSVPKVAILRAANTAPAGPPPGRALLSVNAPIETCRAWG